MTRKDYVLIAQVISSTKRDLLTNYNLDDQQAKDVENTIYHLSVELARALAKENPRFDYVRFISRANYGQSVVETILENWG